MVFWTILKYHSQYYCQIPLQVMLLPIYLYIEQYERWYFTEKKKFTSRGKYFDYTAGFTVRIVTRSVPLLTGFCWHLGITSFHISRFLFPRGNLPVKNFNGKSKILNLSSSVVSREKRTVSSKRLVLDFMAFSPSECNHGVENR